MDYKHHNINYILKNRLCTGCGVCQDACPQKTIHFEIKNGLNKPVIDNQKCVNFKGCNRCFEVCPGKGIDIQHKAQQLYESNLSGFNYNIGYFIKCYSGYSSDFDIRYNSASGGLVSQFLIYLLEKGYINGAIVTGYSSDDKMKPHSFLATSKEEILLGKSSKYCPVALNGMATLIKQTEGKYVVVGLPCHIHGFRNLEEKDKKLKDNIFGYFSIFCSSTRNFFSQDYLCLSYDIIRENLLNFTYRGDGCLGYLKAEHKDGRLVREQFRNYYHSLRSFFKPRRCLTCIDHYGELADVCFGDIQIGDYKKDDIGVNSLIVRNKNFDMLLNDAANEGKLRLSIITEETLNSSQRIMLSQKKKISRIHMVINRCVLKPAPFYDSQLLKGNKPRDILSAILIYLQHVIGCNRKLWFVIKFINKIFPIRSENQ